MDNDWNGLADLIANLITKYAEEIDFDSLSDPEIYLRNQDMRKMYRAYMKRTFNMRKRANFVEADIEIKAVA